MLKFQQPQPLPDGGYRFFALQHSAVDRTLNWFIAENPGLDAIVLEGLRFEGENVYLRMKDTNQVQSS